MCHFANDPNWNFDKRIVSEILENFNVSLHKQVNKLGFHLDHLLQCL